MSFAVLSLGAFTFGALAFSVLAFTYWRERLRGRARTGFVFPLFTLVCALSFLLNLLGQSTLLDLVTSLVPPLLLHLVYEEEQIRAPWLVAAIYVAGVAVPLARTESGPAAMLGVAAMLALGLQRISKRPATALRRWTRWLLCFTVAAAAASLMDVAPWVNLLPDYLVLAFFAVTLYYKERLVFFDLFIKRGVFFALAMTMLALFFSFSPGPALLYPILLAPLWVAAPWIYDRLSAAIDRAWLRRPYSPAEAERRFVHAIQAAESEQALRESAAASLREIFQTTVADVGEKGSIALAPRPSGIPYLSDDRHLLQSLERTLGVVLENVRFRERELELRRLAGRAELKALRAQINPHFLFNALNAIAGLIPAQPALAEETVEKLAEVFRYTLRKSENEWVRLEEEIDFVSACLRIEQSRFGERLSVRIEMDPLAAGIQVPAMCIQPLVENAIKHGVSQVDRQGTIEVRAVLRDGRVSIQVTDNGPGFPAGFQFNGATGHGLRNIAERLSGYYGVSARLDWENLAEGTRVSLEIPCAS
jgi:signal transduction histidine kinase